LLALDHVLNRIDVLARGLPEFKVRTGASRLKQIVRNFVFALSGL
jgi:hypothetical protein